jgi:antitoxin component YwqK of YwqJK toxin-antitoxin module
MRGKLFIPRKLSVDDSRYLEWNNSQVVVNGVRINQYDMDGRKQGYWEDYYDNGKLWSKGSYVNGLRDGYWEYYDINGGIWLKGNFINGFMYEKNK